MNSSAATLILLVDGLGIYRFTPPPAGAIGPKDAWQAFDMVVLGGAVFSVSAINDFLNDVSHDDIEAFSP
jgi:hypothetical protein